jgi:hypothetical protein
MQITPDEMTVYDLLRHGMEVNTDFFKSIGMQAPQHIMSSLKAKLERFSHKTIRERYAVVCGKKTRMYRITEQ